MSRQKNMDQRKEQNKTKKKGLNKMKISNLSDAGFKILLTSMLKELIGYFHIIKKTQAEMKVTLSEIKKLCREPTVKWMKPIIKSMFWNIRKKKNIQSEKEEEKRFQNNEDRLRSLWDNFKHTNI